LNEVLAIELRDRRHGPDSYEAFSSREIQARQKESRRSFTRGHIDSDSDVIKTFTLIGRSVSKFAEQTI
jgi:hypothetical protein